MQSLQKIHVLDSNALIKLSAESNSSKYAIDAHFRDIEKLGDLSGLPKLCSLDVSFNRIKSLENLSTAKHLRELKAYNNQLRTTDGLRGLVYLEVVQMNENRITDISHDMGTLSKLKVLLLSNNRITRVENLRFCGNLVHLDLSRNQLTGVCSEGLECLFSLETLDLSGNKFTGIGHLAHMNSLEELNVSSNHLTSLDGILPVNLVVLKANTNRITDLTSAPTIKGLNELYLQNNSITSLTSISKKFPQLESLDLKNNNISISEELQSLSSLTSLVDIWVEGNPFCRSQSYVKEIMNILPQLKTVDEFKDNQLNADFVRPCTPPSRPYTGARPGTSSRLLSPGAGRPSTPDSTPVFSVPSSRAGNLMKVLGSDELENAQLQAKNCLRGVRDMLRSTNKTTIHRPTSPISRNSHTKGSKEIKVLHSRVDIGSDPIDVSVTVRCTKLPNNSSTEIDVQTQMGDCPPVPLLKFQENKDQVDLLENAMRTQLLYYTNQLEELEQLQIESPRIDSNKTAEQRKAPPKQDRPGYKNFRVPATLRSRLLEPQL